MKEKKIPMRRCVGCMQSKEKKSLIRIAAYEGQVAVDVTGKAKGRGVYLCRDNIQCLENAIKRKSLERGLEVEISPEAKETLSAKIKEFLGEE